MKIYKTKKILKTLSLVLAVLTPLLSSAPVFAASATESLVSAGSAVKGAPVYVTLKVNSGAEPINVATATLNYSADKLRYEGFANSNAFSIAAASSGGGGTVSIDRGAPAAVTGSQTVVTITFRALADSGTATVSIAGGTAYSANSNTDIYAGGSGTSIALKPVPPPVQAAPEPPKDTIPPAITKIKASAATFNGATITWTTSEPATSAVDYGPTKGYGLSATDGNLVTEHKVVLSSAVIDPAKQYHYMVKSSDGAGNAASGADAVFTTAGGKLPLALIDQKNQPLSGAKVSILESSATTDKHGQTTINSVQPGKQTLIVKYKGRTYTQIISVSELDAKGSANPVKAQIRTSSSYLLPIVITILLILVGAALWFLRRGGGLPPAIKKVVPAKVQTVLGFQSSPAVVHPSNTFTNIPVNSSKKPIS